MEKKNCVNIQYLDINLVKSTTSCNFESQGTASLSTAYCQLAKVYSQKKGKWEQQHQMHFVRFTITICLISIWIQDAEALSSHEGKYISSQNWMNFQRFSERPLNPLPPPSFLWKYTENFSENLWQKFVTKLWLNMTQFTALSLTWFLVCNTTEIHHSPVWPYIEYIL